MRAAASHASHDGSINAWDELSEENPLLASEGERRVPQVLKSFCRVMFRAWNLCRLLGFAPIRRHVGGSPRSHGNFGARCICNHGLTMDPTIASSPIRRLYSMNITSAVLARHPGRLLCAGLVLTLASTVSRADERCQQLVALNQQYAGVQLTSVQKQLKSQLVAWYKQNCRSSQSADARH
jgi:hypothetical protein